METRIDISKFKLNGRYLIKDKALYFYNGGSGFSFKMNGQQFAIFFESIPIDSYFYVIIDRDYQSKIKVYTDKYYIHTFKNPGVHYVDIVKANEANDCALRLHEIDVDGEILAYDHQYDKKVKVYGDSTIAGYGILKHEGDASVHTSDSVKDFCYRALYELNYDANIFSASGWGLVFSAYTCPKNIGIIDYFDKVAVCKDDAWFDNSEYDLLLISLGTNDESYIRENSQNKDKLVEEFINKYRLLIDSELSKNPDMPVLMIYGTLNEVDAYYLVEQSYAALKPLYPNLFIKKFNGDNSAISNHAYVDAHASLSEQLKQEISTILK